MTIFVFLGPTLSVEEARAEMDAVYLPPVAQGDVYRATLKQPTAIGIIDGYFDRVPSVWHKEILWAMSQGIRVFGSSSLGALRAAELADFGMEGVGRIFEDYRSGELDGDEEVALAHASAEFGYRALSEPLVNIRATLGKAAADGIISQSTRIALEDVAKALFYPNRTYAQILERAQLAGVPGTEAEALRAFLPTGRVNLKKEDAVLMLRTMRERLASGRPAPQVHFAFERTALWEDLTRSAGELQITETGTGEMLLADELLTELQLEGEVYTQAFEGAMARLFAIEEARRHHVHIDDDTLYQTVIEFRRRANLLDPEDLLRWMKENDLEREGFVRLMGEIAAQRWTSTLVKADVLASLPDYLRSIDQYARLQQRAREKRILLEARGQHGLTQSEAEMERILRWYFSERLGLTEPPNLEQYAERMGFVDVAALERALVDEYLFCTSER